MTLKFSKKDWGLESFIKHKANYNSKHYLVALKNMTYDFACIAQSVRRLR